MNELAEVIRFIFPDDTGLAAKVDGRSLTSWTGIASELRKFPENSQARFFLECLNNAFPTVYSKRPGYTKGAARMLAKINMIPLKKETISQDQLEVLIASSFEDAGVKLDDRPEIEFVDDLEQTANLMSKIGSIEAMGWDLETFKPDRKRHPFYEVFCLAVDIANNLGMNSFISALYDDSCLDFFYAKVVRDMLAEEGGCQGQKLPWKVLWHLTNKFGGATAIAAMFGGQGFGNPYASFVEICRPGLWPIGWDGEKYWVRRLTQPAPLDIVEN